MKASDFFTKEEARLYQITDPDADPGGDIRIRMRRSCSVRVSRAARELEHVDEGQELVIPFAWGMSLVRDGSAELVAAASSLRMVR